MKFCYYILTVFSLIAFQAKAFVTFPQELSKDSLNAKAKRLKELYFISTLHSNLSEMYQEDFFYEFPNNFNELVKLYGYDNPGYGPLADSCYGHISKLFFKIKNGNDTVFYRKIVAISIGGYWQGDGVNFFQDELQHKILSNLGLAVFTLQNVPENKIKSFWRFYFEGPVPKNNYDKELDKIKFIDEKIYNIMKQAYKEVLDDPEWK